MNIIWFTWKDKSHPLAGGAETVAHEVATRCVRDGHTVTFIVGGYDGCIPDETTFSGYRVIRVGTRFNVYIKAWQYYKKNLYGQADIVVDEYNALPFMARYYTGKPTVLFVHHITGKGWFQQISFPISVIGYFLEPILFLFLRRSPVITVSESTRSELIRFGFPVKNISLIPEGLDCTPVESLAPVVKYSNPTIVFIGGIRPVKRPIDVIHAFEIAKKEIPNLELKIAGMIDDGGTGYGKKFIEAIKNSPFSNSIEYLGRVSFKERLALMQKAFILAVTSRKEGWGLVVTEANSQGTPAIVYNVQGLRDSTQDNKTGIVCKQNTPESLADEIVALHTDAKKYQRLQESAWRWSHEFTFEKTYEAFIARLTIVIKES